MKVCPACGTQYGDDAAFCARDRTPLSAPGRGLVGTLLADRYQIERKLGEGGMGEVYLARHILMGRSCALKVVSPTLTRDPDAIGRFNREATNASRISHPNVCIVYDFGLTPEGLLYLAMEYLEGRTLSEALTGDPLPLDRATAILAQCAAGLAAAHELGIVHRDLKPDNVMLVDQRGHETVKLVDFGIAKAGTGEGVQRVTRTGLVVGTPEYMSPEQFTGAELDGRSDQYSLALVFYRMIAGALPFIATSAHETMAKRLTERPRSLAEIAPARRFPAALQGVLDRALERKPDARYPTIDAFARAVKDASTSEVAAATEVISLPRTEVVPAPRRWKTAALLGSGLAVAAIGWFVFQTPRGEPGGPIAGNPAAATVGSDPPPPSAAATDPVQPALDSARRAVVVPPGSVPVPPPPPAPSTTTVDSIELAEGPEDEVFDSASSPRARRAARIAKRIADDSTRPAAVRARNAFNYAFFVGMQQDGVAAKRYYELSCRLNWFSRCTEILAKLKDVP